MNPPVLDQFLQGPLGNFPSDGVKTAQGDRIWRIVNDQVHPSHGFKRADVPAFAADDPPLHVIVWQVHD